MSMEETGAELDDRRMAQSRWHPDFAEAEEDVVIAEAVAEEPAPLYEPYAV